MLQGNVSENLWLLSEASVQGKGHVDANLPNQDAVSVCTSDDGHIVAAVVSDGAGTARKSQHGSRMAADFLSRSLLLIGEDIRTNQLSKNEITQRLIGEIDQLRNKLDPAGGSLRDYHCTLVGCLIMPGCGFICQIGDSIALATRFAIVGSDSSSSVDYFPDNGTHWYEVERGEYANETHFLTESDWRKHLRVSPIPDDVDAVVMMTDGAMDVATTKGKVFRGFLSNLIGRIIATSPRAERQKIIGDWLADHQTHRLTGDDKTIFTAIRKSCGNLSGLAVYLGATTTADDRSGNFKSAALASVSIGQSATTEDVTQIEIPTQRHSMRGAFWPLLAFLLICAASASAYLIQNMRAATPPTTSENTTSVPASVPIKGSSQSTDLVVTLDETEVVVVPSTFPLQMSAGDTAKFSLSLKKGYFATLTIDQPKEEVGLAILTHPESCAMPHALNAKNPSCQVAIQASAKAKAGRTLLVVHLSDAQNKPLNDILIEIEILATNPSAPSASASNIPSTKGKTPVSKEVPLKKKEAVGAKSQDSATAKDGRSVASIDLTNTSLPSQVIASDVKETKP